MPVEFLLFYSDIVAIAAHSTVYINVQLPHYTILHLSTWIQIYLTEHQASFRPGGRMVNASALVYNRSRRFLVRFGVRSIVPCLSSYIKCLLFYSDVVAMAAHSAVYINIQLPHYTILPLSTGSTSSDILVQASSILQTLWRHG
jgi:hypothetical protein